MPMKNTLNSYGSVSKFLHWAIGILFICMLAFGLTMEDLAPTQEVKYQFYFLHKSTGILILMMVSIRLLWKFTNVSPELPEHMKSRMKMLAKLGHITLYFLMFAMPLSGWIMSSAGSHPVSFFGLFTVPPLVDPDKTLGGLAHEAHEIMGFIAIAIIAAHIAAALLHHFYYKDNVLRRMLPFSKSIAE